MANRLYKSMWECYIWLMLNCKMISIALTLVVLTLVNDCQADFFGVVRIPAPVLNSPDFSAVFGGKEGSSLKTDRCGQVRELEYVALPGTAFKILKELKRGKAKIYQVETEEYPAPPGIRLYVDSRFLDLHSSAPSPHKRTLPVREQVLATLAKSVGNPYVWGGNVPDGVPELLEWFYSDSAKRDNSRLTLAGLDCSGLLYQATSGWTPRNTAQLLHFGQPVAVMGKNAVEIAGMLEPLDLIVWNGHVLIVLDRETVIESRLECGKPGNGGVVTTPLRQRLEEILRTRSPVDSWPTAGKQRNFFVIRRWCGR